MSCPWHIIASREGNRVHENWEIMQWHVIVFMANNVFKTRSVIKLIKAAVQGLMVQPGLNQDRTYINKIIFNS